MSPPATRSRSTSIRPSRPAACSPISPIFPACRRSSSHSTARVRSTLQAPSSISTPAPTSGRTARSLVARQVRARRLALDLKSRLEGLAPACHPPDLRRRDDAARAMSLFNDDSSIATSRPASRFRERPARHRGRASRRTTSSISKSTPARFRAPAQIGKLDLNASIEGPSCRPDARRRLRRRPNPCRRRIARPCRRDIPRRAERPL